MPFDFSRMKSFKRDTTTSTSPPSTRSAGVGLALDAPDGAAAARGGVEGVDAAGLGGVDAAGFGGTVASCVFGAWCSTAHALLWFSTSLCTAQQSGEQNCTGARAFVHDVTLHIQYF